MAPVARLYSDPSGARTGKKLNSFAGEADSALLSRNSFVTSQVNTLNALGPQARKALYAASPDFAALSDYVTKTLADPLGGMTDIYRDNFRSAMASQGLGNGGPGVAAGEAENLTRLASQAKQAVAPLALQTTNMLLQAGGLANADYNQTASLRESTRQAEIDRDLVLKQAEESRKMYDKEQAELDRQRSLINNANTSGKSAFGNADPRRLGGSGKLNYSGGSGSNYIV
jgi:hypothetical protein